MIQKGEFMLLCHEKSNFLLPFQPNGSFSTHKGNVKFPDGLCYGDTLVSQTGESFHVVRPTTADLMMKVKRRTTIIYPKEAGTLILELGVQNGTKIIEIGTGSGSFTVLLSRIVGPEGKIYSFERREEHQEQARKNVEKLGRIENVEFTLRDPAVEGGFGLTDMDAIFIDVPAPWTLVKHAHAALVPGGHAGFLSPCIEQVQYTVEHLHDAGFANIRCMEILTRGIRIKKNLTRPYDRMIGHTGYLLFAEKITGHAVITAPEYHI